MIRGLRLGSPLPCGRGWAVLCGSAQEPGWGPARQAECLRHVVGKRLGSNSMTLRIGLSLTAGLVLTSTCFGQQAAKAKAAVGTAHPNLSGIWAYSIDLPHSALKVTKDGQSADLKEVDL